MGGTIFQKEGVKAKSAEMKAKVKTKANAKVTTRMKAKTKRIK